MRACSVARTEFLFFIRIHHILIFNFVTGNLKHQSRSVSVVLMRGQGAAPRTTKRERAGRKSCCSRKEPGVGSTGHWESQSRDVHVWTQSSLLRASGSLSLREPECGALLALGWVLYESHPISISHHHCNWQPFTMKTVASQVAKRLGRE